MAIKNATDYEDTYLALHVAVLADVPVILWGPPGQGKTSVIKDLAEQSGRPIEVILASIREPQDFAGLPTIIDGKATLIAPDWAQSLAKAGNGILFTDEVNTAPPSVQAALLRVCLDKVAGNLELGAGTSIIAAANPPEIAADGWDLAPPLANRFCHLDWNLPADVVSQGFIGLWPRFALPQLEISVLEAAFDAEKLIVGAFLQSFPDLVTVMPDGAVAQGRAFPSPRSWEFAARVSAACEALALNSSVRRLLLVGCLGQAAASQYITYRVHQDLPNPEDILADPKGAAVPARADQLFVVAASVMFAVKSNYTEQRWDSAGEFIHRLSEEGFQDIAVTALIPWNTMTPPGVLPPRAIRHTLMPLLVAAGLQ
jgi:MoxR-like ATPase